MIKPEGKHRKLSSIDTQVSFHLFLLDQCQIVRSLLKIQEISVVNYTDEQLGCL